ncbi:chemotaxis protein CheW [Acetobacterium malicum]|uniref:chemotaxis protein CheW n=1 Tax=Acetobacterium malicum TaxID=52692 RepID=UPI0035939836
MLKVLCFKSGNNLYGIETRYVKEINRHPEITIIPLAPGVMAGIMNLRGQIVSLLDFAALLGVPTTGSKKHSIVLKKEPGDPDLLALLVEQAADVIDVDEAVCVLPTPSLENEYGKTIKLIAKLEQQLLIIVDKEKLF